MRDTSPTITELGRDPILGLAFGFGAGLSPTAPGTAGTLAALPIWWLMSSLWFPAYLGVVVVGFLLGIWICDHACRKTNTHDHSGIVFDEIIGFLIAMSALPRHWFWVAAAFVLFRILDIVKPWPIGRLDRGMGGGLGVMLDDALAGIITTVVLGLLYRI